MLNVDALLAIIEAVKENDIAEIKISNDAVEIRTAAAFNGTAVMSAAPVMVQAVPVSGGAVSAAAPSSASKSEAKSEVKEEAKPDAEVKGTVVEAPIPGSIFVYPGKDMDGNPLPKVGDKVKEGQVIALLEAMKMFNEVFSPVTGIVREIKTGNETNVNPGDPIMVIE